MNDVRFMFRNTITLYIFVSDSAGGVIPCETQWKQLYSHNLYNLHIFIQSHVLISGISFRKDLFTFGKFSVLSQKWENKKLWKQIKTFDTLANFSLFHEHMIWLSKWEIKYYANWIRHSKILGRVIFLCFYSNMKNYTACDKVMGYNTDLEVIKIQCFSTFFYLGVNDKCWHILCWLNIKYPYLVQ